MFPVYYHNFAYITRFHLKFDCFLLFIVINILQNDHNCNQSLKRHKTKQKIIVTRRYSSLSLNNVMWMTCFSGWPALIKKRRWQYIKKYNSTLLRKHKCYHRYASIRRQSLTGETSCIARRLSPSEADRVYRQVWRGQQPRVGQVPTYSNQGKKDGPVLCSGFLKTHKMLQIYIICIFQQIFNALFITSTKSVRFNLSLCTTKFDK